MNMKKKIIFIVIAIIVLGTTIVLGTINKTDKKDSNKGGNTQSMKTIDEKKTEPVAKKQEVKETMKEEKKVEKPETKNEVKKETIVKEEKKEENNNNNLANEIKETKKEIEIVKEDVNNLKNEVDEMKKANEVKEPEYQELENKIKLEEVPYSSFLIGGFEYLTTEDNKILIKEQEARRIALAGFERAARIVGEEITTNEKTETVKIERVSPNNFFTRKDNEKDERYIDIVRTCYSVTRRDDEISGVTIYVDATTGIIIGARAFGD